MSLYFKYDQSWRHGAVKKQPHNVTDIIRHGWFMRKQKSKKAKKQKRYDPYDRWFSKIDAKLKIDLNKELKSIVAFYHGLLPERQSLGHGASCFSGEEGLTWAVPEFM